MGVAPMLARRPPGGQPQRPGPVEGVPGGVLWVMENWTFDWLERVTIERWGMKGAPR